MYEEFSKDKEFLKDLEFNPELNNRLGLREHWTFVIEKESERFSRKTSPNPRFFLFLIKILNF